MKVALLESKDLLWFSASKTSDHSSQQIGDRDDSNTRRHDDWRWPALSPCRRRHWAGGHAAPSFPRRPRDLSRRGRARRTRDRKGRSPSAMTAVQWHKPPTTWMGWCRSPFRTRPPSSRRVQRRAAGFGRAGQVSASMTRIAAIKASMPSSSSASAMASIGAIRMTLP
jgi:hypothetical protein